jgi:hypothetical protein
MNALLLLLIQNYYFLNLTPGVNAMSSGSMSALTNEGLSAFHNPAITDEFKVNFTVGRWLYTTNQIVAGIEYKRSCFGIFYNDYGSIQGYDRFGNETSVFRPNDLVVIAGHDLGPCGITIKGFQETIADFKLYGLAIGFGAYAESGRFAFGVKLDNIGRDFANNSALKLNASAGARYDVIKDLLVLNAGGQIPDNTLVFGFSYNYSIVTTNLGARYYFAKDLLLTGHNGQSAEDYDLTAGLIVNVENYRIGYSLLIDQYSSAHQFSIVIEP